MSSCSSWQTFLDSALKQYVETSEYVQFCQSNTNEERIRNVIENNFIGSAIRLDEYYQDLHMKCSQRVKKSGTVADKFREEGNEHFKKHNDNRALRAYNECVAHAPLTEKNGGDSSLSLGLANRSAVLFHMQKYKECVEDIEKALGAGYPAHLEHKLWMRKAQCLHHLNETTAAHQALQQTREKIHLAKGLTNKKIEELEKNVTVWNKKLHSESSNSSDADCKFLLPKISFGPGPVLRQASSAITVSHAPDRGRYLVAKRKIKAGATLIRERPYAAVLLPDHYSTHCHHCYTKILVATPCCRCSQVRYCGPVCRDASWSSYHDLECDILDILHTVGIAHLSLRVVVTTGFRQILEFQKTLTDQVTPTDSNQPVLGVNEKGTYDRDYTAVYHLMPHTDDMEKDDLLQYTLTSALLLRCLQEGGFFERDSNKTRLPLKTLDSDLLDKTTNLSLNTGTKPSVNTGDKNTPTDGSSVELVGALLLRHICQLICNAHAITELQVAEVDSKTLVNPQSQVRIATALYPTTSLCNHACEPSFINSFHRDTLIVRAIKDISAGDEIFNCYGPQYGRMARGERLQTLRDQYFFDCRCRACKEGERAEQRHQVRTNGALKCPSCSGAVGPLPQAVCLDCGQAMTGVNQHLQQAQQAGDLFVRGVQLLEMDRITDALTILKKCLEIRKTLLYQHHRDLAETNDALARCYATRGKFSHSAEHLASSVMTTEVIYGGQSIELANELHKFAEVLVQAGEAVSATHVIRRALDIFTLHYGNQHSTVQELLELQQCVCTL